MPDPRPQLQWGVNGQLQMTPDGWQFVPPVGPPPAPPRGRGPAGLVAATQDWYLYLRRSPQFALSESSG